MSLRIIFSILGSSVLLGIFICIGYYSLWVFFLKDCEFIKDIQKEFLIDNNKNRSSSQPEFKITRSGVQINRLYREWRERNPVTTIKFPHKINSVNNQKNVIIKKRLIENYL